MKMTRSPNLVPTPPTSWWLAGWLGNGTDVAAAPDSFDRNRWWWFKKKKRAAQIRPYYVRLLLFLNQGDLPLRRRCGLFVMCGGGKVQICK